MNEEKQIVVGGIYEWKGGEYGKGSLKWRPTLAIVESITSGIECLLRESKGNGFMCNDNYVSHHNLGKQIGYDASYTEECKKLLRERDYLFSDLTAIERVKEIAKRYNLPSDLFATLRDQVISEKMQIDNEIKSIKENSWMESETE